MTDTTSTQHLELPTATLAYDVHSPLPTSDGRPPLLMIGQPMDARGFATLASLFPERTVVTYDPRGLGRSTRSDGSTRNSPAQQADDLHHLVAQLGAGPVDLFASSGGAVTALALVSEHPEDVRTLVAHEPPLLSVLPDAERAFAAERRVQQEYAAHGWGAGMAMFIAFTSVRGEVPEDFGAQAPDPALFGLPTQDDGSRGDPLLSGVSDDVTAYRPDVAALRAAPTRVVVAAGIESKDLVTWRASEALAAALGTELTVFPSHHAGFVGPGFGQPGEPEAFAARLREVLGDAAGD
ncbi:alpha/beta fold hydrolase [Cellulomonas sp. SG140]|uniref:alpha/beta fold hydrolase n=1 Tax=Cellulomonas sp. SG140 TaxID=2976536 RepID=UPI0021E6F3DE|nr:alpha/beta hydrolase [Cellulomonas sp. SG140]